MMCAGGGEGHFISIHRIDVRTEIRVERGLKFVQGIHAAKRLVFIYELIPIIRLRLESKYVNANIFGVSSSFPMVYWRRAG